MSDNLESLAEPALALYREMFQIRTFELAVYELVKETSIARFVHLSVGQEAVAAGACSALAPTDFLALTYRNHGMLLARGADPGRLMAEIFCKRTGYCGGRAGSMHILAPELGIIDASAVVAANIPIGTGSALTSWLQEDGAVTLCLFGDGATTEGAFHESVNMAALWNLPVVYVCENNGLAMSTPYAAYSPVRTVVDRAGAYAIPAERVNGNDVFAVRAAVMKAVERARAHQGPSLVECTTSLLLGHFVGHQRSKNDPLLVTESGSDPIESVRGLLVSKLGEEALQTFEQEVKEAIDRAVVFAQHSPDPEPASLLQGNFLNS